MASLQAFRALRPAPAAAARVAAVPYDVVNVEEARALADGNPFSFLHVSRAEIDLPPETDPYADLVYDTAARNFDRLKREAPLVVEDTPRLYAYRLVMGSHAQTGLAAVYSLAEYDANIVKKHERTRRDKEDDRTRHMIALRAQTGPVFLTYHASREVDAIVERATAGAPLVDFSAPDGVRHTIWRLDAAGSSAMAQAFGRIPTLYIADGHHRAASAARAREHLKQAGGGGGASARDFFLAVAFPHDQVQILPYNRVVKDLAGMTPDGFLAALGERFTVKDGPASPARKGEVSMYLAGRWHTIALGGGGRDVIANLDVSLLQEQVLERLLTIGDVRADKRIDFVGGARGTGELERLVKLGKAAVAFSMYPVSVGDLMAIADAGGIMPPKSTWFEPKLRDGLLIHVI